MARNDSTRTKQLSANLRSALVTAALVGTLGGWVAFGSQQAATTATDTTAAVAVVQVADPDGRESRYEVNTIMAGRVYHVRKWGGDEHSVHPGDGCSCKGSRYRPAAPCRHRKIVRQLRQMRAIR